ncbi:class I SAM-dependent methyltransferase [Metabacillus halosaccharovorans]|uniref:class I SAM-dependent methyltransferase n=1 Tax=Metabacillus halosaccharovorans TaxID=930124 RepID=UPI002040717F|nr:class I SAM-dependent methyltransferase [Metabacillus halosaccharovorans]MCM3443846.1 class I SAM-dependent methyltransferase [Metabacillus halosaccharovorans]
MKTTENFNDKAEVYAKYSPYYPNEYIDYLFTANQLKEDQIVADIGSGTGIFSRQLLERGLNVIGIEPNDDMRNMAEQSLKQYSRFKSKKATAENTTLKGENVDLVTVAQAFHWFDKEAFKIECQRILKQKANVALVWNSRDLTSLIMKENAEICQKTCPNFKGFSGGMVESPEIFNSFFKNGKYEFKMYQNDLLFDYEGFLGRNLSASYAPKKNDKEYERFVFLLSELFEKHSKNGKIVLQNITRSFLGNV